MACGTLAQRGGEQAAEGQTAPKSRCHAPCGEAHAWLAPRFHAAKRDDMNMEWDARAGVLGEPNAQVNRRRSPLGRRAPKVAMKMAKPWPVLASALNRQLGCGAEWKALMKVEEFVLTVVLCHAIAISLHPF
jgi:hypothetical protein